MTQTKFKETEIGLIPEDWEFEKISDIGKVITGKTPPTKNKDFFGNKFMFVKIPDMSNDSVYIQNTKTKLSDLGADYMKRLKVKKNSVMISCIATIGKVVIATEDCFSNQQINSIIIDESKISSKWIYYFFKNNKHYLKTRGGGGSVFTNISKSKFENVKISLPSLPEQRSITKILFDLDSKIELLQKQNKTLERTGQTIFKHWFVDFEFPNKEGKPYKSSGGKMVESELGDIPEGWKVGKLGEYVDVQRGLSYKGKFLSEDEIDIPLVNLGSIAPHKGYRKEGIKFYTGEHKERHTVKTGDIVIANTDITQKREVLGSPAIIPIFNSEEILFTHHIYAVRNKIFPNLFLYYLFQKPDYKERAVTFATGTTVLALPKDAILDYEFVVPEKEIFDKFGILAESIFNKIILNTKDLLSLQKTRDLLLPKLMSGKIRVKHRMD